MAINFPSTGLTANVTTYSAGDRTWLWTGAYWKATSTTVGYTGSTGYTGSWGYFGSTGYTGSWGYFGSVGYTGSVGVGYTGSASTVVGYTGSTGTFIVSTYSTTTASSYTLNSNNYNQIFFTALASTLTISADSGSPTDGTKLLFRFKDNGTSQTLTFTTGVSKGFRAVGISIPAATTISKTLYVGCVYNSADSRWDVISYAIES